MIRNISFFNKLDNIDCKWDNYTLIMPCIGVGNVGQLAIDCLIATLYCEKQCHLVGRIYSSSLSSVVGPNSYDPLSKDLMTTCEVYESRKYQCLMIQQRAPIYKGKGPDFVKEIITWIKSLQLKQVIVLTSSFIHYFSPADIGQDSHPFRYLETPKFPGDQMKMLNFQRLEEKTVYKDGRETKGITIPGSGISKLLWNEMGKNDIPCVLMIHFCDEGDNSRDAFKLLDKLNSYLRIKAPEGTEPLWNVPNSWIDLFGGELPPSLY